MKSQRWIFANDLHGDKQEKAAVKAFFDFCADYKPDFRIAGGDIHDFRWLREKANEHERSEEIEADFDAGNEFLAKFAPTQFIEGNHDWRLRKSSETATIASHRSFYRKLIEERDSAIGSAQFFRCDKREGVFRLGRLRVIHGYSEGMHAPYRAAQAYGDTLMGHIHVGLVYTLPTWPNPVRGISSPCLCQVDLGYNNRTIGTLREESGWTFGEVFPNGEYTAMFVKRVGGQWRVTV